MAYTIKNGRVTKVKLPTKLPKYVIDAVEDNKSAEKKIAKAMAAFKKAKVTYAFSF